MSTLIAALQKIIVLSDFKTVTKKFEDQGIELDTITQYLDDFKKLRDRNVITKNEQRNIDFWGKQKFDVFTKFVDALKLKKTKNEKKKLEKIEGAKYITENEDWKVYHITTHKAAMLYGSGTKWCITEEDGERWNEYIKDNDFYFLINKHPENADKAISKIALQTSPSGHKYIWDATDKEHSSNPEWRSWNLPQFIIKPKIAMKDIIEDILFDGVTPKVKEYFSKNYDWEPIRYFSTRKFLAFEEYESLLDVAKAWNMKNFQLLLRKKKEITSSDIPIGDSTFEFYTRSILKKISEELFDSLISRVITSGLKSGDLETFLKEESLLEINDKLTKFSDWDSFKNIYKDEYPLDLLVEYIRWKDDDLTKMFMLAIQDASFTDTKEAISSRISDAFRNQSILMTIDNTLYVGLKPTELYDYGFVSIKKEFFGIFNSIDNVIGDEFEYYYPIVQDVLEYILDYSVGRSLIDYARGGVTT